MNSTKFLPAVDTYIAKRQPFAQPILKHLRALVHRAVPEVEEAMKWQMPFFLKDGVFLANMAAFKAHCVFGLWGEEITAKLKADGWYSKEAMGKLGKITSLDDLPGDAKLLAYLQAGAAVIAEGKRTKSFTRRPTKAAKPEAPVPVELAAALKKSKAAQKAFDAFPPSHRREYIEWIADAKREETRAKRVAQAIEWIAEGKSRNWKYE